MSCPFCQSEERTSLAMGPDMQLREACSSCGKVIGQSAPDPLLQTASVDVKPSPAPFSQPARPVPPQDVLAMAMARLAQLEGELAALAAKQNEADMLRRMIAAAEPPN